MMKLDLTDSERDEDEPKQKHYTMLAFTWDSLLKIDVLKHSYNFRDENDTDMKLTNRLLSTSF